MKTHQINNINNRSCSSHLVFSALLFLLFALTLPKTANAESGTDSNMVNITVVELFTSQNCSSCPPADAILSNMAKNQGVIAMSCHVTYWNYSDKIDDLAREFCDIRQHGYVSLTTSKRVYTPQMIVNGLNPFIGSRKNMIEAAMIKAQHQNVATIKIRELKQAVKYELPELKEKISNDFHVWMFGYKSSAIRNIKKGENSGKTINYVNSAITYNNLGAWNGKAVSKTVNISMDQYEDVDGFIILAQAGGYGRIVAAGRVKIGADKDQNIH